MKPTRLAAFFLLGLLAVGPLPGTKANTLQNALDKGGPRNFFEEWQRYSSEEKKLVYAAIHRGLFGNEPVIDDDFIKEITQSFQSFTAFPTPNPYVHYAQDGGAIALQSSLKRGAKFLEIDAVTDINGRLVFSHSAHAKRQTLINRPWSDVDAQALTQEQRRMITREFKNGQWTERYRLLDDHVLNEEEFIALWLEQQKDTTALLDLKGDAGKHGFVFVKRHPEHAGRLVPMIYNTGYPGGPQQFKTEVAQLGFFVDGSDPLGITTNPNAFQAMAQLRADEFNSELAARRQIEWVDSWIQDLNIATIVVVMNEDWKYYNPRKHIVENHPIYGTISNPEDIRRFEVLWIGEQIRKHVQAHHPGVMIGAPSNRPVLIADGIPYVDHFITGNAVRIEPGTINAYLFEKGGLARHLKDAGAHYVITEDPNDVTGTEAHPYTITDYPLRNYPGVLSEVTEEEWLVDPNYA